jgi:1,2-phenylacetyl-CoA epoxidase PaaB subunit
MNYEVFARIKPGDDIVHIGRLEADSDALATSFARTTYDEEDWDRLLVVRSEHLLEVERNRTAPSLGDRS